MLRRRHKKSRAGCLECKRRHVKCDERRPVLNDTGGRARATSPSASGGAVPRTEPAVVPALPVFPAPSANNLNANHTDPLLLVDDADAAVNVSHAELIVHLMTNTDIQSLAANRDDLTSGMVLGLRAGSAASAARYQRQAVLLQTRAISLFNTAWRLSHGVIDRTNCVPMLLFSSILGHHLFADSLSRRDNSLDQFLEHYMQCSHLQRGVHEIAKTTWPFLLMSEFAPILQWSARFTSRQGRGNDCDQLLQLVDNASEDRLTTADKTACRQAIRLLQVGFDVLFLPAPKADSRSGSKTPSGDGDGNAMDITPDEAATTPSSSTGTEPDEDEKDEKDEHTYRHKMILLWALIMPKEFADLLSAKSPEALVILAYYAWLLNHGKHLWQVGDAGQYIMGLVADYLSPAWDTWLEYPRHRMATDIVETSSP
ncbi:hypothetical protein SBRCBS47491_005259 [Sporothrix bragantina]|uniref:C6 zinc finger domain containing protein n=1 Tax=Sporothrix bragantina TaxID=671064 RepID=A0ABP0BV85_9PEZI